MRECFISCSAYSAWFSCLVFESIWTWMSEIRLRESRRAGFGTQHWKVVDFREDYACWTWIIGSQSWTGGWWSSVQRFVWSKSGQNLKGLTSDPWSMTIFALTSTVPARLIAIKCSVDQMYRVCRRGLDRSLPCLLCWYKRKWIMKIQSITIGPVKFCTGQVAGPNNVIQFQEQSLAKHWIKRRPLCMNATRMI